MCPERIFEMASIDTIFGDNQDKATDSEKLASAKSFAVRLSISQDSATSTWKAHKTAEFITKTFTDFKPFPRTAYCSLSNIVLELAQTGGPAPRIGYVHLTITQDCNSQRGDEVSTPDWYFTVDLKDQAGAIVRSEYLGRWDHACGKHVIDFKNELDSVPESADPIPLTESVTLWWTAKQEVSPC
jgi:hypothetical protein